MAVSKAKLWIHGLIAGAISSFSTAAGACLSMPETFDVTTKHGWANIARVTLIPTALSVFAYLKKSPIPGFSLDAGDSALAKGVAIDDTGAITADSIAVKKADTPPQ
jgi:hypothetical protein